MDAINLIQKTLDPGLGRIYSEASGAFLYQVFQQEIEKSNQASNQAMIVQPNWRHHPSWDGLTWDGLTWDELTWESHSGVCFDLASLTKALFTAPKVFQFACEKGLSLAQPIGSFLTSDLSKLLNAKLLGISLGELLSHRSGLPAWANFWVQCENNSKLNRRDQTIFHLNRMSEKINSHQGMVYSDIGYILLGLILESESNQSLAGSLEEWNLQSGSQLAFKPSQRKFASTGYCPVRRRELFGEVHDENCFGLGAESGHAGLFGTLDDVIFHLKWLLSTNFGRSFIHQNALLRRKSDDLGDGLLGWRQGLGSHAKAFLKGSSIGHLGFTGTALWLDPDSYSFYVLLTNRVAMGRLSKGIMDIRAKFAESAQFYFHSKGATN